jgi:hypothetical protein
MRKFCSKCEDYREINKKKIVSIFKKNGKQIEIHHKINCCCFCNEWLEPIEYDDEILNRIQKNNN